MNRQVANAIYTGEGDPAVRRLQEKVAANPSDLDARLGLASLYEKSRHSELALEHYRIARRQRPDSEDLVLRMAKAYETLDLQANAIEELQAFQASHENRAKVASKLGILLDQSGRHKEAETAHRQALLAVPGDSRMYNNLGYCLLLQERYADAISQLREAVRLSPWSDTARNNLALALARDPKSGDKQDAVAHWSSTASPAAAHNNLAAVYIERKQYQQAREEIANALSYEKDYPPALRNLQLISELDGGQASVKVQRRTSQWHRFWAGMKSGFVKTEESTGEQPKKVANW